MQRACWLLSLCSIVTSTCSGTCGCMLFHSLFSCGLLALGLAAVTGISFLITMREKLQNETIRRGKDTMQASGTDSTETVCERALSSRACLANMRNDRLRDKSGISCGAAMQSLCPPTFVCSKPRLEHPFFAVPPLHTAVTATRTETVQLTKGSRITCFFISR